MDKQAIEILEQIKKAGNEIEELYNMLIDLGGSGNPIVDDEIMDCMIDIISDMEVLECCVTESINSLK